MIIQRAALHILDLTSDLFLPSRIELDVGNPVTAEYLGKHLEKILGEGRANRGIFSEISWFRKELEAFRAGREAFLDFSEDIARRFYEEITESNSETSFDLVVTEFLEEGFPFFGLLLLDHHTGYTHVVENSRQGPAPKLIRNHAILPGESQKINCFALVSEEDLEIRYVDRKLEVNGEPVMLLADRVLQCAPEMSNRNILVAMEKITRKVAEEFGDNAGTRLAKAKNYMVENAEHSQTISPRELGEAVFRDHPGMEASFRDKVDQAELPDKAVVEPAVAMQKGKNQKIRTDTGIEITFPSEYYENPEFIEFINHPDGTISISLKNIGIIISRL
ncbi:nucleoid-associated protein [Eubacterium pyruvativorans]|uniref:nucleoid-associated protein n=1 Tax=Eubacterium pyruvativorans TaxID=155865 RepID=UPI0013D361E2|nr:nucleoid-associated protein [Eubacterium pyruvativorans]